MALVKEIAAVADEMTAWRRDLHAHPELGFQETRTSDLVARQLASFGIGCTGASARPASSAC